ncbi:coiled-coil domain-containing protein 33-like isoform 1-T2 [Liasis olivaceus]
MAGKAGEPRVPATLQKSRLKAEEKVLDFDFQLESVQFNEIGRYALRLTAENPLVEGSGAGVQLQVNEGEVLHTNTATTDLVEQTNLSEVYMFEKRRFLFILPKGFCKNDKNHDARLRIEALRLHGSFLKTSVKTGEAFFAIYPRTNQPRMNLFASKEEDLYRYSDIMVLLRAGSDDLAMHCGRLAYTVSFHEHRPGAKREIPITPRHLSPLLPRKEGKMQMEVGTAFLNPLHLLEVPPQTTRPQAVPLKDHLWCHQRQNSRLVGTPCTAHPSRRKKSPMKASKTFLRSSNLSGQLPLLLPPPRSPQLCQGDCQAMPVSTCLLQGTAQS